MNQVTPSNNNDRIVKNTAALYVRMFVLLFISFFTSRVILESLGVIDYGIYNVVGGVVAMFSFFNAALSGATSRFLTFELGTGNFEKLRRTFQSSLFIHVLLSIVIVFLLETVGLWFVYNKLVLPPERLQSALIVFHISVLTLVFGIMQVPFNASITSHEKMAAFAYIGIYDAIMKLLVAYLLYIVRTDRLVLYAFLLALSSLSVNAVYVYYCFKHFPECSFSVKYDKEITMPMLKFSGWDLYGNFSVMVRSQGLNVLQNLYFGPIVNSSTAVANTVLNALMGFTDNFLTAIRPQIIKQYAAKQYDYFQNIVINSSKYSYYLLLFTTLPLLIEAEYAMGVWLKEVPQYAVIFCQLSIINNWISILYRSIVISISATGQVKRISIINGTIYLLVLPVSYIMLEIGFGPTIPFILNIIFLFIGHTVFSMITIKKLIPFFSLQSFYRSVLFRCTIISSIAISLPLLLHEILSYGFLRFIVVCITSLVWAAITIYIIGMNSSERKTLINFVKNKIFNNIRFQY